MAPDLHLAPCAGYREIDGNRGCRFGGFRGTRVRYIGLRRGMRGFRVFRRKHLLQPIPELRDGLTQSQELVDNGIPGEMQRIAGVVDMTGERGRTLTAKRKGYRKQIKSVERGR